jgi:hypothetical protein
MYIRFHAKSRTRSTCTDNLGCARLRAESVNPRVLLTRERESSSELDSVSESDGAVWTAPRERVGVAHGETPKRKTLANGRETHGVKKERRDLRDLGVPVNRRGGYALVAKAYDAVHHLRVMVHYRSCGRDGGNATALPTTFAATTPGD